MSFGVSAFFSGMLINGLIAQRLRDAGWKIRNTDGQLGEYSSRFLAVDRLGFSEDDLMDAVVRRHLQPELIGGGEFDAPAASAARASARRRRRIERGLRFRFCALLRLRLRLRSLAQFFS